MKSSLHVTLDNFVMLKRCIKNLGKIFHYFSTGEGCSHNLGVGWWYLEYPLCFQALATGQFQQTGDEETKASAASAGLEWTAWKGNDVSLLSMAFMIRPVSA